MTTENKIPEGYTPSNFQKPMIRKVVKVIFNNGEEAIGYYYDNYYRSGWLCNRGDGLFVNYAWSGLNVEYWK